MSLVMLKVGKHIETDRDGVERLYSQGSIFDSVSDDLAQRWPEKFDRADPTPGGVSRGTPTTTAGHVRQPDQPPTAREQVDYLVQSMDFTPEQAQKIVEQRQAQAKAAQPAAQPQATVGDPAQLAKAYRGKLERMTVPQLLEEAASEEVDVKGERDKTKLIALLCSFQGK